MSDPTKIDETLNGAYMVAERIMNSGNGVIPVQSEFVNTFRVLVDATLQLDDEARVWADKVNAAQEEFERSRPDLFEPYRAAQRVYRDAVTICQYALLSGITSGLSVRDMRDIAADDDFWGDLQYSLSRHISGDQVPPRLPESNPFE